MVGIVVAGHGEFPAALLRTAEMIYGTTDGCTAVQITDGDSPDDMKARLSAAVGAVNEGDGVLILLDLFGGSPSNVATLIVASGGAQAVTGVNAPMLLEVLAARATCTLTQLRDLALHAGATGIKDLQSVLKQAVKTD